MWYNMAEIITCIYTLGKIAYATPDVLDGAQLYIQI